MASSSSRRTQAFPALPSPPCLSLLSTPGPIASKPAAINSMSQRVINSQKLGHTAAAPRLGLTEQTPAQLLPPSPSRQSTAKCQQPPHLRNCRTGSRPVVVSTHASSATIKQPSIALVDGDGSPINDSSGGSMISLAFIDDDIDQDVNRRRHTLTKGFEIGTKEESLAELISNSQHTHATSWMPDRLRNVLFLRRDPRVRGVGRPFALVTEDTGRLMYSDKFVGSFKRPSKSTCAVQREERQGQDRSNLSKAQESSRPLQFWEEYLACLDRSLGALGSKKIPSWRMLINHRKPERHVGCFNTVDRREATCVF